MLIITKRYIHTAIIKYIIWNIVYVELIYANVDSGFKIATDLALKKSLLLCLMLYCFLH